MNRNINESFVFLLAEYKRLKLKKEKIILTNDEEETLNKLKSFIGKEDE